MVLLLLLSQVIVSPPPRKTATICRMSVASCARLKQLMEEDTEIIGEDNIVAKDYEPLYPYELYKIHTPEWGVYPTEQRKP